MFFNSSQFTVLFIHVVQLKESKHWAALTCEAAVSLIVEFCPLSPHHFLSVWFVLGASLTDLYLPPSEALAMRADSFGGKQQADELQKCVYHLLFSSVAGLHFLKLHSQISATGNFHRHFSERCGFSLNNITPPPRHLLYNLSFSCWTEYSLVVQKRTILLEDSVCDRGGELDCHSCHLRWSLRALLGSGLSLCWCWRSIHVGDLHPALFRISQFISRAGPFTLYWARQDIPESNRDDKHNKTKTLFSSQCLLQGNKQRDK